ncbi:hypothetical protein CBR_g18959 [Chara braunii]|uniref:Uncharacterized protein n=1 Tax=Chara braunii TaxID=69332 RepID=A0A388KX08_CHABU|nr:hypothetical protein CBR_g18959 [Chara braunii]|eukprot:GBG74548.1 hypothetical protein CBR_g18959 [Chara braunii]
MMSPVPAPTSVIPQRRWAAWIIFILVLAGYGAYCAFVVLKAVEGRRHPPSHTVMKNESQTLPDVYFCLPFQPAISSVHTGCFVQPSAVIGAPADAARTGTVQNAFQWGPAAAFQNLSFSGNCTVSYSPSPVAGSDTAAGCFRYQTYGMIGKRGGGTQPAVDLVLSFNGGTTTSLLRSEMCRVFLVYQPFLSVNASASGAVSTGGATGGGTSDSSTTSPSSPDLQPSNSSAPPSSQLVPSATPSAPATEPEAAPSTQAPASRSRRNSTLSGGNRRRRVLLSLGGRKGKKDQQQEEEGEEGEEGKNGEEVEMTQERADIARFRQSAAALPISRRMDGDISRSQRLLESPPRVLLQMPNPPPTYATNVSSTSPIADDRSITVHRVEDLQVVGSFFVPLNMSSAYSMSLSKYKDRKKRVTFSISGTLSSAPLKTGVDYSVRPQGQSNAIVLSLAIEDKGVIYTKEEDPLQVLTILGLWGGFWQFALLVLGLCFVSTERQAPHLTVLDPKMLMEGICPACFTEWIRSLCMRKRGRSKYNSNLWEDDAPR